MLNQQAFAALSTRLRELADEIDDVALEVEQRVNEAEQGSVKLRQLQALLKEL